MAKPTALPIIAANIPAELKALKQWVCWRYEQRGGKWTKVPYCAGAEKPIKADSTDPNTWGTFDLALATPGYDGIGFVFAPDDGYCGIDLDAKDGPLSVEASDTMALLDSYTERSAGGVGLHIIAKGALTGTRRRKGAVEMYDRGRYFAMTGHIVDECATINPRQAALDALVRKVFGEERKVAKPRSATPPFGLDDSALLAKARRARNGADFERLWSGDASAYGSPSEADAALCSHLAFWTNGNAGQIDRLFRQSGLMREKWDREDYRERTIAHVLDLVQDGYDPQRARHETPRRQKSTNESPVESAAVGVPTPDPPARIVLDQNSEAVFAEYMIRDLAPVDGRLVSTDGRLYLYDDATGVWSPLDAEAVRGRVQYTLNGAFIPKADGDYSCLAMSDRTTKGTYSSMLRQPSICRPGFFDEPVSGIAFTNGFVRVDATGIHLEPHSPDHRARQRLASAYEPGAESPSWLQMLNAVFEGDHDAEDKRKFLQEFAGACMCGLATTYDRCAVLVGAGGNGKSTTQQALEQNIFLPGTVSHVSPQKWKQEYSVSQLCGKLVNIVSELPSERLTDNDVFKGVITGDVVSARDPYKPPYEFRPRAGHIFACNDLPSTNDLTDGFWQRFVFVTFNRNFRISPAEWESRESILARIRAEAPGLALWALHGAVRLLKHGYTIPGSSGDVREEWHRTSCSVREWATSAILQSTNGAKLPSVEVYRAYRQWTLDNGRQPVSSIEMGRRLARYGYKSGRTERYRFWVADWLTDVSAENPMQQSGLKFS